MKINSVRKLCSVLMLMLLGLIANAQPNVPVSPEAAALAKMINYPVSFNTGVPNISIPLYTIETGGLSLPIDLDYHAGGFKINEKSTNVGLGWSLSSDIQITRTVNGLDDFAAAGYIANTKMKHYSPTDPTIDHPIYTQLNVYPAPFVKDGYYIAIGELDGAPDKFNYKLLNKSGSFYFRKSENGHSYTIVPVPFDNIKISYNNKQFTIVDTDGTTYFFGSQSYTDASNVASSFHEATRSSVTDVPITAYKCRVIYNANRTHSINFTYQPKTPITYNSNNQSIEYYSNDDPCGMDAYFTPYDFGTIPTYEYLLATYRFFRLSSPKYVENFSNGKSIFHMPYLDAQNNVLTRSFPKQVPNGSSKIVYGISLSSIDFDGGSVVFSGADQISSLVIRNYNDEEVKSFNLFHSIVLPPNIANVDPSMLAQFTTRYLDSVQVKNGANTYETYKLMYKNKAGFGDYLQGKDTWGYSNAFTSEINDFNDYTGVSINHINQRYYRGVDLNNGCTNYVDNVDFVIGNGNSWNMNTEATTSGAESAGMLAKIIYPTGGYTIFEFESNKTKQDVTGTLELVAAVGGARVKSIANYDGVSLNPTSYKFYRYGDTEDGTGILINSPYKEYDVANRTFRPFSYTQKTAYVSGAGSTNIGDDFAPVPGDCGTRNCLYINFSERKTTYLPASSIDYTYPHGAPIYYTKVTEYNQDLGKMTGKIVHTYYKPEKFLPYSFISDAKIPETNINVMQTDGLMGMQKSIESYEFANGRFALVHSKESEYIKYSKPEQVRVVYAFQKTTYELFRGNFSGDMYNYNYDMANAGSNIYQDILAGQYGIQVAKLLLTKETEKWVNGIDTTFKFTEYEYNNANYPQVSKINTSGANSTISKTFKYAYDFPGIAVYDQMLALNRLSTVIEEVSSSYGSNGYTEIGRSKTNYQNINSSAYCYVPINIQQSVTGQPLETTLSFNMYDAKANVLQITEKNRLVKSYVWGYGGRYPIVEIVGATYPGHLSIVAASYNLSSQAQVQQAANQIRSQLPYAMVKGFTYQPMVGVTSITEPNGKSRHFEYDPFGRLSTVKNDSLQALNHYGYHLNKAPLAYADHIFLPNDPIMLTFNKIGSDNKRRMTNAIQWGGTYHQPFSSTTANSYAEDYLNLHWYPIAGDLDETRPEANTLILLNIWPSSQVLPQKVYLDLLQNGHIVVSKEIPYNTANFNFDELYIEPGTYQISLRFDENYNGSLNHLQVSSALGYTRLKTGDTYTLQAGIEYMFILFNG